MMAKLKLKLMQVVTHFGENVIDVDIFLFNGVFPK